MVCRDNETGSSKWGEKKKQLQGLLASALVDLRSVQLLAG